MVFTYLLGKMGIKLLEIIRDEADKELHPNESQIREKLVSLEALLEAGQISEEEYETEEAGLVEKWREIQQSKKEQ